MLLLMEKLVQLFLYKADPITNLTFDICPIKSPLLSPSVPIVKAPVDVIKLNVRVKTNEPS